MEHNRTAAAAHTAALSPLEEFLTLVDIAGYEPIYKQEITNESYFGMPLASILKAEKRLRTAQERTIAYFSMEYGLASSFYNRFNSVREISAHNRNQEYEIFSNFRLADYFFTVKTENIIDIPLYSGGLGVLAGDTVKTMADYKLPAVAVGMLWNSGYFNQKFWFKFGQLPEKTYWDFYTYPGLIPLRNKIKISLAHEDVYLRLWKYYVYSYTHDYAIPLILLDANVEPNSDKTRQLTDQLYRSDNVWIKIMQRLILGMGGVEALSALGYAPDIYHLNEGHAVFSYIQRARGLSPEEKQELKKHFVYTCHTPVEAGHDRFSPHDLVLVLKKEDYDTAEEFGRDSTGAINLTLLSMNVSSSVNAVSRKHQRVMQLQFPLYRERIQCVTNGVHPHTWMSGPIMQLMERYASVFEDIQANPMALIKTKALKEDEQFRKELWQAHQENKNRLCSLLGKWNLNPNALTICWARRIAAYKRPSLLLKDVTRLIEIAKKYGPLQIIFAGKAHPNDNLGFTYFNEMFDKVDALTQSFESLRFIMMENYDISLGKLLTSSVDVWLNTPLPPFEASGTSGMKAILNGVLQISTLDGWVVEAEDRNIGKIFGYRSDTDKIGSEYELHISDDAQKLYAALEETAGLYYACNRNGSIDLSCPWIDTMIDCLAAGSEFNTYRMLDQYKKMVWGIP